jgi:6-phosphogluconolactonase (cycloisomerase 2 family)
LLATKPKSRLSKLRSSQEPPYPGVDMSRPFRIGAALCFGLLCAAATVFAQQPVPKVLYVVNYVDANVSAFTVEPLTGQLTTVPGSPYSASPALQGIALTPDNKYLYTAGQSITAFSINQSTGALTQIADYPIGTNLGRLAITPDGKYLYAPASGIYAYSIDPATGLLTAVPGSPFDPGVDFGGGAATPDSRFFYADGLIPNGVYAYSIQSNGALFTIFGSPYDDPNTPIDTEVDPSGRYVYIVNYGGGVSGWAIDQNFGTLTLLPGSPYATGGDAPNAIAVAPNGRAVVVDNQAQGTTASLAIQPDGSLQLRGTPQPAGANPNGVIVDPTSQFVYTSSTSASNVSAYRLDPVSLVLLPVPGLQWPTGNDPYDMRVLAGIEPPYCPLNNVEPSVTICSPQTTTPSPARIVAGTTSSSSVQQIQVLVDGSIVFRKVGSNAIDEYIDIPAGSHTLTVQAVNRKGQQFSSERTITVSGTGTANCSARGIFPTVAICSPLGGSTTGNSVHVVAQSVGVTNVSATAVYVDGVRVYSVSGGSVNTYVTLSSGMHRITVQSTGSDRTTWGSTVFVTTQ